MRTTADLSRAEIIGPGHTHETSDNRTHHPERR